MYRLNILKHNILMVFFVILITGCGGGGSTAGTPIENDTSSNKAVHSGQVKDSFTGQGIEDVTVIIGDANTTTDDYGYYTFSDLVPNEEIVINFEKSGYLLGSTQIQLKPLSKENTTGSNFLEFFMRAHENRWSFESSNEVDTKNIFIDASYVNSSGELYIGTISAELTILDLTTDEGKNLFSGSFQGIDSNGDIVQFESYGLISVQLKDDNDNILDLDNGETATLTFDRVASSEYPDTIPLWYYDYDQGLWIEEGYAQLQDDGTYKGEISHLGTWSLNIPLEEDPGILIGRIIDEYGIPIGNVRVYAVGENWVSSDLTTDDNGVFILKVIPGENFQLTAYDYENKYGASYDGEIAAIESGDVKE